jgi:replicative DNA helicase
MDPNTLWRVIKVDLEVEKAVLGAILQDTEAIYKVRDILSPGDLSQEANRKILEVAYEMEGPVDLLTLTEQCKRLGVLGEIGGASYLTGLIDYCPSSANVDAYVRAVREQSNRRKLREACLSVAEGIEKGNVQELAEKLQAVILEVSEGGMIPYQPIGKVATDYFDHLQNAHEGKEVLRGIRPGIAALEKRIGRFRPGNLIVIGGRPGMGKSALCVVLTLKFVAQGKRVGIFSPEMTREELFTRFLAIRAQIDLKKIVDPFPGVFAEGDWPKIVGAMDDLNKAGIMIDDTPAITLAILKARAHRMVREDWVEAIFVDHMGQMRTAVKHNGARREEISTIAQGLKALAKELRIPIFALSQLNREPEDRGTKLTIDGKTHTYRGYPQVSDLRESGDVEQEADVVLLPYRPAEYNKGDHIHPDDFWIRIGKQRQGATGRAHLKWRSEFAEIFEGDDSPEPF